MEQNISYVPRSAIKSQVLAYFVAEWTEIQTPQAPIEHETWIMYFGGSVTKEEAGAGLVFVLPLGVRMEYMVRLHFPASNNITEYESFINGLRIAVDLRIWHPEIRGDSELVIDQVMKEKNCVNPNMAAYCQAVRELEGKFHGHQLHYVVPPDSDVHSGPTRDLIHHFIRRLLLQNDALWDQKCECHILEMHVTRLQRSDRANYRGIR
jgi:ribonuclease HI